MKNIAFIEDREVIDRIFAHLKLTFELESPGNKAFISGLSQEANYYSSWKIGS